ncbi:MAG: DUF1326 domain-containing protein [Armatimonadetes bacterium]|nr:DUF1326 domain-containing protein [Armatimonadota bacterium]MDE2205630.1 DUF1326 domain-containing protein [Armatimonadota bacterium]
MKLAACTAAVLAACATAAMAAPGNGISAQYVEARTASVFAGACHYGGEVTTTGRKAEMAWHVTRGVWRGVDVSGLNALAAVVCTSNLKSASAPRKSVLYIDSRATNKQAAALADALKATCGAAFGNLMAIKRAPIEFAVTREHYTVSAEGITRLVVDAMPNHECCKQPNLVWYQPLVKLNNRRVGYTRTSGMHEPAIGANWTDNGQNTAFYGAFSG